MIASISLKKKSTRCRVLAMTTILLFITLKLSPLQAAGPVTTSTTGDTLEIRSEDGKVQNLAPEFQGLGTWFNSEPLTIRSLKGKVVLVDFWTYSCINCQNTLPHVKEWYKKYADQGLVVVGIHTPEFAYEKDESNVQTAIKRNGILYPVAQDNNFQTWRAYENKYWPAFYFIDVEGVIRHVHYGEGEYDKADEILQRLLQEVKK